MGRRLQTDGVAEVQAFAKDGEKMRFYVSETISENISETPEGFLLCQNVPITRLGEFIYKDGEVPVSSNSRGEIVIARDEEEVFSERAMKSFEGKPITINHPNDFVNPENWSDYAVGTVQNVRRGSNGEGDLLMADLLVNKDNAIELVKSGLRELSCGYDAQYEEIGEGRGRQKEIIGNHVALVTKGRAGNRCSIGDRTYDECPVVDQAEKIIEKEVTPVKKTLKQRVKKWFDEMPDELGGGVEVAPTLEGVAGALEDIADKVDNLADGNESADEEEKIPEKVLEKFEKKEEGAEAGAKDDDGGLSEIKTRLARLEEMMEAFFSESSASEDGEGEEGEKKTEGEEGEKKAEAEDGEEEDPEKKKEEEILETSDCIAAWPGLASRAEILFPGMELARPTKDHKSVMRATKLGALKGAFGKKETKDAVELFVHGQTLDKLTPDALDAAFMGASALVAAKNNQGVQSSVSAASGAGNNLGASGEIKAINQANRDFYKQ